MNNRPIHVDRRTVLKTLGAGVATTLLSGTVAAHGDDTAHANSDLAAVRQATEQYHDIETALDDGFINTEECVPNMGVHVVQPQRMQTATVDAERPEILLYEPHETGNGETQYKLVGVEYYVVAAQVADTPTVLGQDMHGPMPGHGPDQPEHYDLHAWLWRANPNGVFEESNPNVTC